MMSSTVAKMTGFPERVISTPSGGATSARLRARATASSAGMTSISVFRPLSSRSRLATGLSSMSATTIASGAAAMSDAVIGAPVIGFSSGTMVATLSTPSTPRISSRSSTRVTRPSFERNVSPSGRVTTTLIGSAELYLSCRATNDSPASLPVRANELMSALNCIRNSIATAMRLTTAVAARIGRLWPTMTRAMRSIGPS